MSRRSPSRRSHRATGVVAALAVAVGGAGCGSDDDGGSRAGTAPAPPTATAAGGATPVPAAAVGTPDGLLRWMAEHRGQVGLSVRPDRGGPALEVGAEQRFPLASVRKVLIVGALVDAGTSLRTRIPRAAVDRFDTPTNRAIHAKAKLDPRRPTLRQVADAAISISDNAAADALLQRVGAPAVDRWARAHGLDHEDPIHPLLGEFASWGADRGWADRTPEERATRSLRLARTVDGEDVRTPPVAAQRPLAAASVAGTPGEWSRLMREIGRRGDGDLVSVLDWPRRAVPENARAYDRFLAKGGSLPGVVTEADYLRPKGRPGVAVALFLKDVPPDVQAVLAKSFSQQVLVGRLVRDPAFLDRARKALAPAG